MNNFRGELTDISAEKEALCRIAALVGLCPFFQTTDNSTQAVIRAVSKWPRLMEGAGTALGRLPSWAARALAPIYSAGMDQGAIDTTEALFRGDSFFAAFYLASTEFNDLDNPTIWSELPQLAGRYAVLLFQPKYRFGQPESYLFLLSKKTFFGSKYPKKLFCFIFKTEALALRPSVAISDCGFKINYGTLILYILEAWPSLVKGLQTALGRLSPNSSGSRTYLLYWHGPRRYRCNKGSLWRTFVLRI